MASFGRLPPRTYASPRFTGDRFTKWGFQRFPTHRGCRGYRHRLNTADRRRRE